VAGVPTLAIGGANRTANLWRRPKQWQSLIVADLLGVSSVAWADCSIVILNGRGSDAQLDTDFEAGGNNMPLAVLLPPIMVSADNIFAGGCRAAFESGVEVVAGVTIVARCKSKTGRRRRRVGRSSFGPLPSGCEGKSKAPSGFAKRERRQSLDRLRAVIVCASTREAALPDRGRLLPESPRRHPSSGAPNCRRSRL
jgi:hypothetical protein